MKCAFCGEESPLTREHIWPKWAHDSGDMRLKYNIRANKVMNSEQVVKDVCARCNNGELSNLDAYVKYLYDNYFSAGFQDVKNTEFTYDFGKLSRWLLKVAYNSARASKASDATLLQTYSKCIISPNSFPCFSIFSLELLGDFIILDENGNIKSVIPIKWFRCTRIKITKYEERFMTIRQIMINGWVFTIAVSRNTVVNDRQMKRIMNYMHGEVISPIEGKLIPPTFLRDADSIMKHFSDNSALYKEAIENEERSNR